jgi:hypothetical protein
MVVMGRDAEATELCSNVTLDIVFKLSMPQLLHLSHRVVERARVAHKPFILPTNSFSICHRNTCHGWGQLLMNRTDCRTYRDS